VGTIFTYNGKILAVDKKLAANEACCCDDCPCLAQTDALNGKIVVCNGSIVLPDIEGDCPGGTYAVNMQLFWSGFPFFIYTACSPVNFGNGVIGRLDCILSCTSVFSPEPTWGSIFGLNTSFDCDFSNGQCSIGGFLGFSNPAENVNIHKSKVVDGVCIPLPQVFERTARGITCSYSISVT
jgi:hypothetical protein